MGSSEPTINVHPAENRPSSAGDTGSARPRKAKNQRHSTVAGTTPTGASAQSSSASLSVGGGTGSKTGRGARPKSSLVKSSDGLSPHVPATRRTRGVSSRGRRQKSARPRSKAPSVASHRSDSTLAPDAPPLDPNQEFNKLNDMMDGLSSALELTLGTLGDGTHAHDDTQPAGWRQRIPIHIGNFHLYGREVGHDIKESLEDWLRVISRKCSYEFVLDLSAPTVTTAEGTEPVIVAAAQVEVGPTPQAVIVAAPTAQGGAVRTLEEPSDTEAIGQQPSGAANGDDGQKSRFVPPPIVIENASGESPESQHVLTLGQMSAIPEESEKSNSQVTLMNTASTKRLNPNDKESSLAQLSSPSSTPAVLRAQLDEGKQELKLLQEQMDSIDLLAPLPISAAPSEVSLADSSLAVPAAPSTAGGDAGGAAVSTAATIASTSDVPDASALNTEAVSRAPSQQTSPMIGAGDTLTEETVMLLQGERAKARQLQVVVKGALERVMTKLHDMEQQALNLEKEAHSQTRRDQLIASQKASELNQNLEEILQQMIAKSGANDEDRGSPGMMRSSTEGSLDAARDRFAAKDDLDLNLVSSFMANQESQGDLLSLAKSPARGSDAVVHFGDDSDRGSSPLNEGGKKSMRSSKTSPNVNEGRGDTPNRRVSSPPKPKRIVPPPLKRANTEGRLNTSGKLHRKTIGGIGAASTLSRKSSASPVQPSPSHQITILKRQHTKELRRIAKTHQDTLQQVISSIQDAYGAKDDSIRLMKRLGEATAQLQNAQVELATVKRDGIRGLAEGSTSSLRRESRTSGPPLTPRSGAGMKVGKSYTELQAEHLQQQGAMYAPKGKIALVFTDVESSTDLWEWDDHLMSKSLDMHDRIMRTEIERLHGYEVKTEGDAFMVAFESPIVAVNWCLTVQSRLLAAEWNDKLLEHPSCAVVEGSDGTFLFRGLRVRMGVHVGSPIWRRDPMTRRMDYFGPVVNRAARVASSAHGGQIVVSGGVYAALAAKRDTVPCTTVPLGHFNFKGLKTAELVVQVDPTSVGHRQFPPLRGAREKKDKNAKKKKKGAATPKTPSGGAEKSLDGEATPRGTLEHSVRSDLSNSSAGSMDRASGSRPTSRSSRPGSRPGTTGSRGSRGNSSSHTHAPGTPPGDLRRQSLSRSQSRSRNRSGTGSTGDNAGLADAPPHSPAREKVATATQGVSTSPMPERRAMVSHAASQANLFDPSPPHTPVTKDAGLMDDLVLQAGEDQTAGHFVSIRATRKLLAEAARLHVREAVSEDLKREYDARLSALTEQLAKITEAAGEVPSPMAVSGASAAPSTEDALDTSSTGEKGVASPGAGSPHTSVVTDPAQLQRVRALETEKEELQTVINYLETTGPNDDLLNAFELEDEQDLTGMNDPDDPRGMDGSYSEDEDDVDDDDDDDDDDESSGDSDLGGLAKLIHDHTKAPSSHPADVLDAFTTGSPLKIAENTRELDSLKEGIEMQREELNLAEMHITALNEQNMVLEEKFTKQQKELARLREGMAQQSAMDALAASREETVFWRNKLNGQLREAQNTIRELKKTRAAAFDEARRAKMAPSKSTTSMRRIGSKKGLKKNDSGTLASGGAVSSDANSVSMDETARATTLTRLDFDGSPTMKKNDSSLVVRRGDSRPASAGSSHTPPHGRSLTMKPSRSLVGLTSQAKKSSQQRVSYHQRELSELERQMNDEASSIPTTSRLDDDGSLARHSTGSVSALSQDDGFDESPSKATVHRRSQSFYRLSDPPEEKSKDLSPNKSPMRAAKSTMLMTLDGVDEGAPGPNSSPRPPSGSSQKDRTYDPGVNRNAVVMLRRLLENAQTSLEKQKKEFQDAIESKNKEIARLEKDVGRNPRSKKPGNSDEVFDALGLGFGAQALLRHAKGYRTARAAVCWRKFATIYRIRSIHKDRMSYPPRSHDYEMLTRLLDHQSLYIESLDRAVLYYTEEIEKAKTVIMKSIEAAAFKPAQMSHMRRRMSQLGTDWHVPMPASQPNTSPSSPLNATTKERDHPVANTLALQGQKSSLLGRHLDPAIGQVPSRRQRSTTLATSTPYLPDIHSKR